MYVILRVVKGVGKYPIADILIRGKSGCSWIFNDLFKNTSLAKDASGKCFESENPA